ncbi:hypothetical protein [Rhizobacter sp. Root404]|uniref:hypothetical protein n=1 Tax=Rhizobacter sp. Root404 TaxID=1736528 RepID=UPI000B0169A7|nr:hypothetical protein [Rhizobacter sp. Root404]
MTRMIVQSRADRLLKKDYLIISQLIVDAWRDYQQYPFTIQTAHTPRTRASAVHDHMVLRAREAFASMPHAKCIDHSGLFIVLLYDRIALRFKKLDDEFRSSNIPTQQSLDFVRQESELPGIKTMMNLQAGYRLNRLQTDLEGVYVACPRGAENLWIKELPIVKMASSASVISFPPSIKPTPATTFSIKDQPKSDKLADSEGG